MSAPTDNDEQFANTAKALFDESVEGLDAATLSKLNRGRQAALAELSTTQGGQVWSRWLPATGVAVAALVAVLMLQSPSGTDAPDITDAAAMEFAMDMDILLNDDNLEMIEDLEFFSWIEIADLEAVDNVG